MERKLFKFDIYERLRKKYEAEGYKQISLSELSRKVNSVSEKMEPEDYVKFNEIIYAIILHHQSMTSCVPVDSVSGSRPIQKGKGVSIHLVKVPTPVQQLIRIFAEEFINDKCPEQE